MFELAPEIADVYERHKVMLGDPTGPFALVGQRMVNRLLGDELAQVHRQSFAGGDIFLTTWDEGAWSWGYSEPSVYIAGRFVEGDNLNAVPQPDGRAIAQAVSTPSGSSAFGVYLTLPWTLPGGAVLKSSGSGGNGASEPPPGPDDRTSDVPWWAIGAAAVALGLGGVVAYRAARRRS